RWVGGSVAVLLLVRAGNALFVARLLAGFLFGPGGYLVGLLEIGGGCAFAGRSRYVGRAMALLAATAQLDRPLARPANSATDWMDLRVLCANIPAFSFAGLGPKPVRHTSSTWW